MEQKIGPFNGGVELHNDDLRTSCLTERDCFTCSDFIVSIINTVLMVQQLNNRDANPLYFSAIQFTVQQSVNYYRNRILRYQK